MPAPRRQAGKTGWLILLLSLTAGAAPDGPYARQLAAECDALIELAVKKPYGWAWHATLDADPVLRRPQVQMRPPGSPGAGMVLLWAGAFLEEPRYTQAAVNVARGIVVSQAANGNVIAEPTFAAAPGGREPPSEVPDRAPTRAGMSLLLAVVGAEPERDEMFRRAGIRAATWLTRQQARDGGWPSAQPVSPDAPEPTHTRAIRLDSTDFRDSTFALLLAENAAGDRLAGRAAIRSIEKLTSLRLGTHGNAARLWSHHYRLDGVAIEPVPGWAVGVDALASRRAIETMLGAALLASSRDALQVAVEAKGALAEIHDSGGLWPRLSPLAGDLPPQEQSTFGDPASQADDNPQLRADFGISALLSSVDRLDQLDDVNGLQDPGFGINATVG